MGWRLLAAGSVLLLAAASVPAQDLDPSAGEVRERARILLADAILQTELPDGGGVPAGASSDFDPGDLGRGRVGPPGARRRAGCRGDAVNRCCRGRPEARWRTRFSG